MSEESLHAQNKETSSALNEIDRYIDQFPEAVKIRLQSIREVIRESAPMATERFSYQMPTFHYQCNLVHFAAFSKHIGFYPGSEALIVFQAELQGFKHSKGAVQFPLDQAIPFDLIRKITEFRYMQENDRLREIKERARHKKTLKGKG